MNIFALDSDPKKAAQWHVDKHVVNMPRESCQMLCTAVHLTWDAQEVRRFEEKNGLKLHKTAFPNHPCTIWARESYSNWRWLQQLALELLVEHYHRYGVKRSEYYHLISSLPYPKISDQGLTPFAMAMPDWIQEALGEDPVTAYKVFYCNNKTHLFAWKNRPVPAWIPRALLDSKPGLMCKSVLGFQMKIRKDANDPFERYN